MKKKADRSIQLKDEDEDEDELDTYAPQFENDEDEEDRKQSGMIFKELTFSINDFLL